MKRRLFIFVALPYANGPLHLGQIAGAYLPYDAFRRYAKLRGYDVISASGSDEHGTPITIRAIREGIDPSEIAKKFHAINSDIFRRMGIEFDAYIETSSKLHADIVSDFLGRLNQNGFIYESKMVQPYWAKEKIFLADRYVKGTCPHCGYESATGDQCENCGATLDPTDLINPVCIFDNTTPEFRETTHLFFRLSKFEGDLLRYIDSKTSWRPNVVSYSMNFIKGGLKDRPITRDLNWGVKVPFPGYENKRIYVWFEALIGYLTGVTMFLNDYDLAKKLWRDKGMEHYYFMGKDNIAFHSIIWPAMLLAHGEYQLPHYIAANEYLNFQGEKFSKSRGVGISMPDILNKYNSEYIRFGVFYSLPEEHDSDFSIEEFENKVNTELIDKFGNFVNRALILAFKKGTVTVDQIAQNDLDLEAEKFMRDTLRSFIGNMEEVNILKAFRNWLDLARYSNNFITRRKPWEECKKDSAYCNAAIYTSMKIVFYLSVLGQVFLPETSSRVLSWLGYESPVPITDELSFPVSRLLKKPEKLFEKIVNNGINLKLKVALIEHVLDHPNAQKLYVLDLKIGDEKRRIVSGIKDSYSVEQLIGKKIVVVANLKPANIRGIESNGMLLAAEDETGVHLVLAPEGTKDGAEIKIDDYQILEEEINIDEFRKFDLKSWREGENVFPVLVKEGKSIPLEVNGMRLTIDGNVREGLRIK